MTRPVAPDPGVAAAIRRGFAHLLDFSGRDTRRQFWPYASFLLLIGGTAAFLVSAPTLAGSYMQLVERGKAAGPDASAIETLSRADHPQLVAHFDRAITGLCVIGAVQLVLLAAALARRRHDRDWLEVAAALVLPATALIMLLSPRLLPVAGGAAGFGAMLYGLIRGGAPERIVTLIYIVNFILYVVLAAISPAIDFRGVEPGLFAIDGLVFVALALVAIRADRFWPLWVVAFSGLILATHLAALLTELPPWAYLMALSLWSYAVNLVAVVGIRAHRIRLAQNGSDPAWTRRAARGAP